ncbi:MAG: hypothetical protein IGS50_05940 [Synechococcales cyanobacterium C42_A2020_086]|jgi:hypothetical protein|nr:hypothetical protein [Synechococcales cyanobacterium M58_A2018_015]MBF2073288.1 hypothetical protein [Synechococcales cyanobacterium C42_A2020_086]
MAKEFELGSVLGLPEFRTVLDTTCFPPRVVVETRTTLLKGFLVVERDEMIDEALWKAIGECLLAAGAGAAVAGVVPGGMVMMPTFMQLFGAHATSKGLDLALNQLRLRTETCYGEWQPWILGSNPASGV